VLEGGLNPLKLEPPQTPLRKPLGGYIDWIFWLRIEKSGGL
jgi:hypothetical protein